MSLLQITNLWPPFTGHALDESQPYTPVVHYHALEGPSKQIKPLIGPDKTVMTLRGPNKQVRILAGSK